MVVMKLKKKNKSQYLWIFKIILVTFIISMIFTVISETIIPNVNIVVGIVLMFIFIGMGVLFDMVGVAVTSADEKKFHSMASKKIKGARTAVKLKKNASKVSSFCNDVIGDICGIISGSTAAVIAISITNKFNLNSLLITVIIMAIVSSITIGGKAMGKGYAINKGNDILFRFSKILSIFTER